jgi:hypothetical protein
MIISGFPGVGKSHSFKILSDIHDKVLDSDSSLFDKSQFPKNYLDHIEEKHKEGYLLFVSSHEDVRKGLEERGLDYILIHPKRELKDEYLERYRSRGSSVQFLELMENKWDDFIDSCELSNSKLVLKLDANEYMMDIFYATV